MNAAAPERILLAYSTTDGHTLRICQRLQQVMESEGKQVTISLLTEAGTRDLSQFDRIVIGASIRYGKHQPTVAEFISRHQALLESRPSAFFTVNIVARKPNKNTPETNPYLIKYLKTMSWQPALTGVFAGKLNYPIYGPLDRLMIRFIMLITSGPTDPKTVVEFTDWAKVEEFGRAVCALPVPTSATA
ncbi:menaquinone-dependent protoporphyrinogen IX dehydrogenase [Rhodoferax sp.]|uniref:menaquinone-dependent protoporphyrinogen IX dehydrogenase n=1 Tax=Rhodoferax sp. TaxID=50421 RepID=UPI0019FCDFC8|nr:menaquinone-dependent protoporphyrinogen IX dehydrogenase [Rhodoferax sp.]MBE0474253.1 menaquinone-dependent protoporphyrinogen IX dehydrogenase [Rhodoferax sp.]